MTWAGERTEAHHHDEQYINAPATLTGSLFFRSPFEVVGKHPLIGPQSHALEQDVVRPQLPWEKGGLQSAKARYELQGQLRWAIGRATHAEMMLPPQTSGIAYEHRNGEHMMQPNMFASRLCKFHQVGRCRKGSSCLWAHGITEMQPIPDLTKTSLLQDGCGSGAITQQKHAGLLMA
eukprot:CAMPEP_0115373114 /NCGR_PEP_ID=MMETSP0271-20121206/1260_1 /TAXON_ID=71861 /ORGANISM="Scrippsiella trochoidea, Strain CCMP3099" /LENGTH=176 /DNA_ID=CAMNT_0002796097 /DNA_START=55 /DNA_END=586 /DNA_ORIENTATION=+